MKIVVKVFSLYRQLVGMKEIAVELKEGSPLGALMEELVKRYPSLGQHQGSMIFSVNREYADLNAMLEDGDEVAVMPPVSGGSYDKDSRRRLLNR